MRGQWLIEEWYFNQTSVIAESFDMPPEVGQVKV